MIVKIVLREHIGFDNAGNPGERVTSNLYECDHMKTTGSSQLRFERGHGENVVADHYELKDELDEADVFVMNDNGKTVDHFRLIHPIALA